MGYCKNLTRIDFLSQPQKCMACSLPAHAATSFFPVIYPTEIVRQLMALCLLIYILQYSVARKVEIMILFFAPLIKPLYSNPTIIKYCYDHQ